MTSIRQPIGYYVHHMGSGHARRARHLVRAVERPVTILSSYQRGFTTDDDDYSYIYLPEDHAHGSHYDQDIAPVPDALHFAPVNVPGIRQRSKLLAQFFANQNPALLVVDVSVEITLLARLCSVPTLGVRLTGRRDDAAHVLGYQACRKILATFPEVFEDPSTPDWMREKTVYLGGFSRHDANPLSKMEARGNLRLNPTDRVVTLINGRGGEQHDLKYLSAVARANPDWVWLVIGNSEKLTPSNQLPKNLRCYGIVDDTYPFLKAADVVVGTGGTNVIMETGRAGAAMICLPEERPFAEQITKARALADLDLAIVPAGKVTPESWSNLLRRAEGLTVSNWKKVLNPKAPRLFADVVESVVAEYQPLVTRQSIPVVNV